MVQTNGFDSTVATGGAPPSASAFNPAINNGTAPLTGFSTRYNADQLGQIYNSPFAILPDVFSGMNLAGPGYQSLRNFGGDPLTLYNIMQGRDKDLSSQGVGGYTNWLASLYKALGSNGEGGGREFQASELLKSLFNPVTGKPATGVAAPEGQSALYNILTSGDGGTQMRTLFNMARDASNVGMNPLAARGYQSALSRAGDQAINMQMNSANDGSGAANTPIYQLLRQIAPGLVPG